MFLYIALVSTGKLLIFYPAIHKVCQWFSLLRLCGSDITFPFTINVTNFQSKQCFSKHFRKVSSGWLVFLSRLLMIFAAPPPIPSSVNASSAAFCATSAACCASSATFCAFSTASSAPVCASFDAASAAFWDSNATFSTFSAAFCAFSAAFLGWPQLWNLKELD